MAKEFGVVDGDMELRYRERVDGEVKSSRVERVVGFAVGQLQARLRSLSLVCRRANQELCGEFQRP
jgi:hypothetical protein